MKVAVRNCALALLFGFAGCSDAAVEPPAPDMAPPSPFVDRPYQLHVPSGYDANKATPLVIMLHGYAYSGTAEEKIFGLTATADAKGFLYAVPDGTKDELNLQFWNATDSCCNIYGAQVDDVSYLKALIKDVKGRYNVDARRVFLIGHSNGGFMSYRMACEAAEELAGVISLAGATWQNSDRCKPSGKVAVLQIHGDLDTIIKYDGGRFADALEIYPSAQDTVGKWAKYNGCTGMLVDSGMPPVDLDDGVPGAETVRKRYDGCTQSAVELWTIQGGGHFPQIGAGFRDAMYQFLMDHPKP